MPNAPHPYHIISEPSASFTGVDVGTSSLAAGRADGTVTVWHGKSFKVLRRFEAPSAASPPAKTVVAHAVLSIGCLDETKLWVHRRGLGITIYNGDDTPIYHLATANLGFCNATICSISSKSYAILPLTDLPFSVLVREIPPLVVPTEVSSENLKISTEISPEISPATGLEQNEERRSRWGFELDKKYGMAMRLKACPRNTSVYLYFGTESGSLVILEFGPPNVDPEAASDESILIVEKSIIDLTQEPLLAVDVYEGLWIAGSAANDIFIGRGSEPLQTISLPLPGVSSLAFRREGRLFAAGTWSGHVFVYSLPKYAQNRKLVSGNPGICERMHYTGTGMARREGFFRSCGIQNIETDTSKQENPVTVVKMVNSSVKNKNLEVGDEKNPENPGIGDRAENSRKPFAKKCRLLAVLEYHTESIEAMQWGPQAELVIAGRDGKVSFWKLY